MNPTRAFRISVYLPPAIAAAALGYAESSLLPEVGVFAILVLIALVLIYRLETKVRHLTVSEFNTVGAGIALVAILWAGFRIAREIKAGEFANMGWVAFGVTLIAPILLAAVCALLLRRDKTPRDYWFIQGPGLAAITLAGALAEETVLVVLTAAYALCAVWFLLLFFEARTGGTSQSGRRGVLRAAAWCGAAAILAVPVYLLTPRSSLGKIDFGQPRIEIGYAADQMVDLTQTGELRDNPEPAFEVVATNRDQRPVLDLRPDQRWRGAVLMTYSAGAWRRDSQARFPTIPTTAALVPWTPPDLGPGTIKLAFTVPTKLRSSFLFDPVEWEAGEEVPVADVTEDGAFLPWYPLNNGSVFGRMNVVRVDRRETRYVQFARPSAESDLSPPYIATDDGTRILVGNPLPSIREYSDQVIADLVDAGRLPAAVRDRDAMRLLPPDFYHEAIARAFRDHLSERAGLVYTTSIKRVNKSVDPVEDFLFHSKAGHCERFATALVLMLRAQGIPAVVVLGFKGCEHTGDGHYVIRQEHAHAWAEALVMRPDFANRRRAWHWLSLDPAPVQSGEGHSSGASSRWSRAAFERFIFHYTPEERERALRALMDRLSDTTTLLGAAALLLVIVGARYALRRRARAKDAARTATQWYGRLVADGALRGVRPHPGETPLEFANRFSNVLPLDQAGLVIEWVEIHYRDRFGGVPRFGELQAELESRFAAFELALRNTK